MKRGDQEEATKVDEQNDTCKRRYAPSKST